MVLVTGGSGFLGSYIIKGLIENGYAVRATRRTEKDLFWIDKAILDKVEWVNVDVLDVVELEEAMQGVDVIIHAAAIVSFSKKDRKKMYQINVEGTANVVNLALEKNIKRLIHISSVAALGRSASGGHVDEEKKWENNKVNTHYAKSKFKAEIEVWRGMAEGLPVDILNPATILGYGDWHSSSCSIFKTVFDEFKWYSNGINGFVNVEDVVKVLLQMLQQECTNNRFIVSSENWSFKKLMDEMATNFHKTKPQKQAKPLQLSFAWRLQALKSFFTRKTPVLTKEKAKVALSQTYFSNEKIIRQLPGFSFTTLETTIKNACEKYNAKHLH